MADTTDSYKPQSKSKIKFVGAASREFESLGQLALENLDIYCPQWKSIKSHIIPPLFEYMHPDLNDQSIEKVKKESNTNKSLELRGSDAMRHQRLLIDRDSDSAENIVYNAICQLIREDIRSPFMAFHGVSTNRMRTDLTSLFPQFDSKELRDLFETKIREYDFLLIGPRIGVIVIEVKGSHFTQNKHFAAKSRLLPDVFLHGLKQVESLDFFLDFLSKCTGISTEGKIPVRKILFTPNLSRNRLETWKKELEDQYKTRLEQMIGDVIVWYREDMADECKVASSLYTDKCKPPLYATLRRLVENCDPMSVEIYEKFAPIIAALGSVTGSTSSKQFTLEKWKFSEADVISTRGIPSEVLKSGRVLHELSDLRINETSDSKNFRKLMYLTPDQLNVMNGSERQFIIGPAGTGKTVLIQAKAWELLERGQSVLVVVSESMLPKYKELFQKYGERQKVCLLSDLLQVERSVKIQLMNRFIDFLNSRPDRSTSRTILAEKFGEYLISKYGKDQLLEDFRNWFCKDHILIDDALTFVDQKIIAHSIWCIFLTLILMVIRNRLESNHVIWVAIDSYAAALKLDERHIFYESFRMAGLENDLVQELVLNRLQSENPLDKTTTSIVEFLKNLPEPTPTSIMESLIDPSSDHPKYFSVNALRQVMRCTENIFHQLIDEGDQEWKSDQFRPVLGHKIQGLPITYIRQVQPYLGDALKEMRIRVKSELDRLRDQGIDLSSIAIITEGKNILETLKTYLREQSIDEAASMKKSDRRDVSLYYLTLDVHDWTEVTSLEWPVVIFVSCAPGKAGSLAESPNSFYGKYYACSRAISKLIEIMIEYEDDLDLD